MLKSSEQNERPVIVLRPAQRPELVEDQGASGLADATPHSVRSSKPHDACDLALVTVEPADQLLERHEVGVHRVDDRRQRGPALSARGLRRGR
jgi:hypothetical protein